MQSTTDLGTVTANCSDVAFAESRTKSLAMTFSKADSGRHERTNGNVAFDRQLPTLKPFAGLQRLCRNIYRRFRIAECCKTSFRAATFTIVHGKNRRRNSEGRQERDQERWKCFRTAFFAQNLPRRRFWRVPMLSGRCRIIRLEYFKWLIPKSCFSA